jgi:hypothetical protein
MRSAAIGSLLGDPFLRRVHALKDLQMVLVSNVLALLSTYIRTFMRSPLFCLAFREPLVSHMRNALSVQSLALKVWMKNDSLKKKMDLLPTQFV